MEKRVRPDAETAPGVDFQDERGSLRYVGGGPKGGQNWANEGYGAGQSYSAGDGYSEPAPHDGGDPPTDVAVSPDDLDVKDYDLQGGYGQPAQKPEV